MCLDCLFWQQYNRKEREDTTRFRLKLTDVFFTMKMN